MTLLPGSRIVGAISLGDDRDIIRLNNGVSTVLTFADDGNGVPEAVSTSGLPFVVNGTTVAILDPSGLNQYDEMLSDLTSGIFNSVHARLGSGGGAGSNGGAMALGMFGSPDGAMGLGAGNLGGRMRLNGDSSGSGSVGLDNGGVWGQAFGGIRQQDGRGLTHGSEQDYFGGIGGVDMKVMPGVLVGAFGGGSHAQMEIDADGGGLGFVNQEISAESYFGGVYGRVASGGLFANFVFTAGSTDYESDRGVLFNLAPNGLQIGHANYNGTFVSPEVAVGTTLYLGGIAVEPSMRIRYAHLSLDGYSESGAIDGLSIGGRDVSLWQGRAQVAFPFSASVGNGGIATFSPRIGVEGRTSGSDTVSAVLLGQAISFDPGGKDEELTGFVGATASVDVTGNVSLFMDGEVHAGDDGITRSEARVGLKVSF